MNSSMTKYRLLLLCIVVFMGGLITRASAPQPVDLGLSVQWADRNLGAEYANGAGNWYAFGETQSKGENQYSYQYYRHRRDKTPTSLYKKLNDITTPFGDQRMRLKPEYDPARSLGPGWRLPTYDEMIEFRTKCRFTYVKDNGKKYVLITGPNGKSIKIELSGINRSDYSKEYSGKSGLKSKVVNKGSDVYLMSSDIIYDKEATKNYTAGTKVMHINKNSVAVNCFVDPCSEWVGVLVRPVYDPGSVDNDKDIANNDAKAVISWPGAPSTTSERSLTVKVGINSKSTISSTTFYVNGVAMRGIHSVRNDGYDMVLTPAVTLNSGRNTLRVEVVNSAGKSTSEHIVTCTYKNNDEIGKAAIEWIGVGESTHSAEIKVKAGIRSKSEIKSVGLTVNGVATRGIKSVRNDGYDMTVNESVLLKSGRNSIVLTVTNAAGTVTSEKTVFYMPVEEDTDRNKDKHVENSEKRVALVVGNSSYSNGRLLNPVNDATDMASKLRGLGFDVTLILDADKRKLEQSISGFARKAEGADVAMFFYAGHGMQVKGTNYLVPVDAEPQSESDVAYECTDVNRVLENLEDAGSKMNIIALDACRNNPMTRSWHRGGGTRGLSVMNAPVGTFISYATAPGAVASDGEGRNSPYTSALLSELDVPRQPIETVFKHVARKVFDSTGRQQQPWYASSLFQGEFIFNR